MVKTCIYSCRRYVRGCPVPGPVLGRRPERGGRTCQVYINIRTQIHIIYSMLCFIYCAYSYTVIYSVIYYICMGELSTLIYSIYRVAPILCITYTTPLHLYAFLYISYICKYTLLYTATTPSWPVAPTYRT